MFSRIHLVSGLIIILPSFMALAAVQRKDSTDSATSTYAQQIEQWRAERLQEINGEDGWNTLVGLFWLKEGRNRIGSDPSSEIVLPRNRAPRRAASLWLSGSALRIEAKSKARLTHDGAPVSSLVLQSDADGKPTLLRLGSLKLFVIKRGNRYGLRVKDSKSPARTRFAGLDYFPIDAKWKIEARFESYNPSRQLPIVNVLGMVDNMTWPGGVLFELDRKSYRLEAVVERGEKQLFIIFADQTTAKETYGAGRYLYADPPGADGKVVLDFNKAYNPPCAFTKFATCPLPPKQNRLALRVLAGEKKYAGAAH